MAQALDELRDVIKEVPLRVSPQVHIVWAVKKLDSKVSINRQDPIRYVMEETHRSHAFVADFGAEHRS
jgi:hypothetical protein